MRDDRDEFDGVSERFNQQRIDRCFDVWHRIYEASRPAGFQCRVVVDQSPIGKPLAELRSMYFAVGIGEQLTDLPLLDFLCVLQMIVDVAVRPLEPSEGRRKLQIRTEFSADQVGHLLNSYEQNVGFEVRPAG